MGFFEVLKLISKDIGKESFTKKDLVIVSGLSERSVERHLSNLIKCGFVKVNVYKSKGLESEYSLVSAGDLNEFLDSCFN